MTMLLAASPNAQLMAVIIKQARAAHWLRSAQVYDDNAIGGIVENTVMAVMISKLARRDGCGQRECTMAMLLTASPNAQLMVVMIKRACAAHWLQSERVHNDNAVSGIDEGTAHSCDDQASSHGSLAAVRASVR